MCTLPVLHGPSPAANWRCLLRGSHGLLCRVIQHLEILTDVFYLDGSSLKAYSLTDNLTGEVAKSQIATAKEATLHAVHLVHSLKQASLLVFFKRANWNGENRK